MLLYNVSYVYDVYVYVYIYNVSSVYGVLIVVIFVVIQKCNTEIHLSSKLLGN